MKRISMFGVIAAILLIVTAASAAALSASPAQLTVGDRNTRASNPQSVDNTAKNSIITGTITVTNTDNEAVNNLRLGTVVPKLGFQVTDLLVNATFSATTLAVNASTTATISVRVPEKLDAVVSTSLREAAFNVADFTILSTGATSGATFSTTPQLFVQRANQLKIKDIEICVNDNCKTVRNNGDIENIRPGDKLEVKVEVENRYSTSDREDLDIDDAELEVEIDDNDFDEEDRETLSTIGADSETEETFSFDVDDDVRDGSYKMLIRTFGRDELGAFMGEENEVRLKVEREAHEIEIRRATVSPGTFPCSPSTGRQGRVTVSATNIGRRDENNVAFELSSTELGIKERIESLRMDRDNSRTETLAFNVPDTAKAGTYQLLVKSFFDNTAQSDSEQVPLVISDCTGAKPTTGTSTSGGSTTTTSAGGSTTVTTTSTDPEVLARLAALANQVSNLQSQPQQSTTVQAVPTAVRTTTNEPVKSTALPWVSGFANSGLYIALLSGVIVLIIIVLIALIIKFLAPRP